MDEIKEMEWGSWLQSQKIVLKSERDTDWNKFVRYQEKFIERDYFPR